MVKLDDSGPQKPDRFVGAVLLLAFIAALIFAFFIFEALLTH